MAKKTLRFDRMEFEGRIGVFLSSLGIPLEPQNYVLPFIHRSCLNELDFPESNERLEFLGDAVLELITTEFLFDRFPEKTEGELTDLRSALVRGSSLAETADRLGF